MDLNLPIFIKLTLQEPQPGGSRPLIHTGQGLAFTQDTALRAARDAVAAAAPDLIAATGTPSPGQPGQI